MDSEVWCGEGLGRGLGRGCRGCCWDEGRVDQWLCPFHWQGIWELLVELQGVDGKGPQVQWPCPEFSLLLLPRAGLLQLRAAAKAQLLIPALVCPLGPHPTLGAPAPALGISKPLHKSSRHDCRLGR